MLIARPLLVGIGNPNAGDDAVGRLVASRLAATASGIDVGQARGNMLELMALFERRDFVVVVDACRCAAPPGSVHRFDANEGRLPAFFGTVSSHGLGLADAIEMMRMLDELPGTCIVYAIAGAHFELGDAVSPPVLASAERLIVHLEGQMIAERSRRAD